MRLLEHVDDDAQDAQHAEKGNVPLAHEAAALAGADTRPFSGRWGTTRSVHVARVPCKQSVAAGMS
jgi:hypothetical protein